MGKKKLPKPRGKVGKHGKRFKANVKRVGFKNDRVVSVGGRGGVVRG